MYRCVVAYAVAFTFVCGLPARAQETDGETERARKAAWAPLALLTGVWEGAIDGRLGTGRGLRRYTELFDGQYVEMRHESVRPPQDASPEGDHHRELALFSFDRHRRTLVLREFMVEGYVLEYRCTTTPSSLRCETERVESGPDVAARLNLDIESRFRFTETFELKFPGEEMKVYFTNVWARVPSVDR